MALTKQMVGGAAVALARRRMVATIVSASMAAVPISAAASQTVTESFSLTVPPTVVPSDDTALFSSTPIPFFPSTAGTLDSVTGTINGSLSWASVAESPSLVVF
jgi:hypothetical protein